MHNFVYLAQRRSQEFSCEPNFRGAPLPLGCASGRNESHVIKRHVSLKYIIILIRHMAADNNQ